MEFSVIARGKGPARRSGGSLPDAKCIYRAYVGQAFGGRRALVSVVPLGQGTFFSSQSMKNLAISALFFSDMNW